MPGQRTVNVVALAVRGSGPSAKRFGLIDAFLPKNGREYDGHNEQKRYVEAGADHGADVEIAAAAAAFGVRRHAHGDACACGGRTGWPMCCAVRVQPGCSRWAHSRKQIQSAVFGSKVSGPCFSPRDEEHRQTDSFKCCCSSDVADRLSAADGERDRTPRSSACVGLAARTQRASTAPTRISQLEQKPLC